MLLKQHLNDLFIGLGSAHVLGKLASAKKVEMQVLNGLAAVVTSIIYNAVAVSKTCISGNFGNCLKILAT